MVTASGRHHDILDQALHRIAEWVPSRRDTVFAPVPGANDPHQHYFINDPVNFDWFHCTAKNKRVLP